MKFKRTPLPHESARRVITVGRRSRAAGVLVSTLLAWGFAGAYGPAYSQQIGDVSESAQQRSSVFLRGTTGSGEQEAVFSGNDPIVIGEGVSRSDQTGNEENEAAGANTAGIRDTSDPERQLQGRVRREQPALPVIDPLNTGTADARSNGRVTASQEGTAAIVEDNPFAALGTRVGSWRAFSSLEQTIGYSTNIDSVAMGDGAAFSQTQIDLSLQSDWSRHSARIDANGIYRRALNSDSEDLPSANVTGTLNLDLTDGHAANFTASYDYTTESVTSTNITSAAAERPGVHAFGGSAEIARSNRKLTYALRGSVGRTVYEDIVLTSGDRESQRDRDNTLYALTGRVGYQATPALAPFVELEAGYRDYDLSRDFSGQQRDSTILAARAGVAVDLGEKLNGEVAVGYRAERFEDNELDDLSGLTLDGNVVWSPERETTITFNAQTGFDGSTTAGQNGSINFAAGVAAERQINDRLSVSANAGISINRQDDGSRTDTITTVGAGFNYWLNRFMALTGAVEHTNQQSTAGPSEEYDETVIRGGIRFQR